MPATVVQEHRYKPLLPRAGEHQVERVVAVHVAGRNAQSADWSIYADKLARPAAELEVNPILGLEGAELPALHRGDIELAVAIEVRNGEGRGQLCGRRPCVVQEIRRPCDAGSASGTA